MFSKARCAKSRTVIRGDKLLSRFSPANARIKVSVTELQRYVIVGFEDEGIGIPEMYGEKVYDPLTKAKRIGTEGEFGNGLGFSISKYIVEAHFTKKNGMKSSER